MGMIQLEQIINQFEIQGDFLSCDSYGNGHINDTYRVKYKDESGISKYVLQRINHNVFRNPEYVVHNINLVLSQFHKLGIENLRTFSANGKPYIIDSNNDYWRLYNFVSNSKSVDVIENQDQAYEAANAYASFLKNLAPLDPSSFYETIPQFHDLGFRYDQFEKALANADKIRLNNAKIDIEYVQKQRLILDEMKLILDEGNIPLRITHNDTKLNNVLLDKDTGKALCVIDLDTVMPAYAFNDYGDMIRTFTSPVPEDESDQSKVYVRKEIFESLTSAYISGLKDILTKAECNSLLLGAKYMVLIIGLRFLTDYLAGDTYFKVHYDTHNLVRARNQFALLRSIEDQEVYLQEIIQKFSN